MKGVLKDGKTGSKAGVYAGRVQLAYRNGEIQAKMASLDDLPFKSRADLTKQSNRSLTVAMKAWVHYFVMAPDLESRRLSQKPI